MGVKNSYLATLEILKILDKYHISLKDANIVFSIILDPSVQKEVDEYYQEYQKRNKE